MGLEIKIDVAALASEFQEFAAEVEADLKKGVANLAALTHAHVAMTASEQLNSSRTNGKGKTEQEIYSKSLKFETIADGIYVVGLEKEAIWIEDGLPANFDMKPGLLTSDKTVTHPSGIKTLSIPFEHSKSKVQVAQMTPRAQAIIQDLRTNLRKEKLNLRKIEKNADGSPKLGLLHTRNFKSEIPGKGNTPALHRVNIYQSMKGGNIRRDIMTFRTVSSGPASAGKFLHPGLEGKHYLEEAYEWALKMWEEQILPEILEKWRD
jgi:hypothetical protein